MIAALFLDGHGKVCERCYCRQTSFFFFNGVGVARCPNGHLVASQSRCGWARCPDCPKRVAIASYCPANFLQLSLFRGEVIEGEVMEGELIGK
jgi:hypothetical protein